MIEIIKEKELWCDLIGSTKKSDFYHTYDYHQIAKNDDEIPVLIKYTENDITIAIPLLIRKIQNTNYFDATSVYGYPGPVCRNVDESFNNKKFFEELQLLFQENNFISIFSRLNPYVDYQEVVLKNIGEIHSSGKLVNIDLTKNLKTQSDNYQKRLRTYINKSRKLCTVRKANTKEEILLFKDMYYENMKRVGAKNYYFFNEDYFFNFFDSNSFETVFLVVIHNETQEIIAGGMFVKKNQIVQYHLSGSREAYLYLNPIKLLIDEMRIIAHNEGYIFFNLGGGVGNKKDNLFRFKSGFSKDFKQFKLWKYIVNQEIYEELVSNKKSKKCLKNWNNCSDYFPCYRCDIYS